MVHPLTWPFFIVLGFSVVSNLILTEIAYSRCKDQGGAPPSGRWNSGQYAFWRYIRLFGEKDVPSNIGHLAMIAYIIHGIGYVAMGGFFVTLFL